MSGTDSADMKYAGIVSFASKLFGMVIGLVFQITVTRRLSPTDFGLYQLVLGVVSYFVIPASIISYWSARESARGAKVIPTALAVGFGLSLLSSAAYLALSFVISRGMGLDMLPFLVGTFMLVPMLENTIIQAIVATVKPRVAGYVESIRELVRAVAGFVFVILLKLELAGALLSWAVSFLSAFAAGLVLMREKLEGGFRQEAIKRWMGGWWLPFLNSAAGLLSSVDILIVAALSSMLAVSYISASDVICSVVFYTIALVVALYPQMLVGGSGKNVDEAFRFWLLFSVPITLGICSLAPAFAYVLRKEYAVAYLVIILRTLASFFVTFGDIMVYAASGHEKLSPESGSSGKPLASSSTLKMVVVKLVSGLLYLGVIFLVLHSTTLGDVGSAILVALTYALVSVMSLIPLYSIARSLLRFKLPMESLARYALYFVPSLVLIWVFYPTGAFSERILDVLINLFPIILASAVLYFSVALALDPYFRQMVQSFISRLTRRK